MVFLIQNTQNRDAKAMQLKLDELIKSNKGARDDLIDLENLADEELDQLEEDFQRVHEHHRSRIMHLLREQVRSENRRRDKRSIK